VELYLFVVRGGETRGRKLTCGEGKTEGNRQVKKGRTKRKTSEKGLERRNWPI